MASVYKCIITSQKYEGIECKITVDLRDKTKEIRTIVNGVKSNNPHAYNANFMNDGIDIPKRNQFFLENIKKNIQIYIMKRCTF